VAWSTPAVPVADVAPMLAYFAGPQQGAWHGAALLWIVGRLICRPWKGGPRWHA